MLLREGMRVHDNGTQLISANRFGVSMHSVMGMRDLPKRGRWGTAA